MKPIEKFLKTISKLRGREGCPWDKVQTHKTLKRYLIEEAYEAIDAINKNDSKALMEELGDVLLQVVLHSQIASEKKKFTFNDLVNQINRKMISRHPHVFGDTKVKNADEVMKNWEILKKTEKQKNKTFDSIPNSLPALLKAWKVSKKVAKEGFDWDNEKHLWKSFEKELKEFKLALKTKNNKKRIEEFGDLLFMITNIARWYKIDPEDTLNEGTKKFIQRYIQVKKQLDKRNKKVRDLDSYKLNKVWEDIKRKEDREQKTEDRK